MNIILAIVAQAAVAGQANPILDNFTPRDLYVSCSLALSKDRLVEERTGTKFKAKAPATCFGAALRAWSLANSEDAESPLRFCPKGNADFDSDMLNAMATTYLRFYEENAVRLNSRLGYAALVAAFKAKWPCR